MITKYIVLVPDGMADWPIPSLGHKTPLEYANTPNLDRLARRSTMGLVKTIPAGFPSGSDVANLSVMGYDPQIYYTGRSPLEAISMGVPLGEHDVAYRCNLVTLSEAADYHEKIMIDYSADEISTSEARDLMGTVQQTLGSAEFSFYPGVSYRHLMVWHGGCTDALTTPPHDIHDRVIGPFLPGGTGAPQLLHLMKMSNGFLSDHQVNYERKSKGMRPANSIWLWGQGRKPVLPSFMEKYSLSGSVISAVDLTKGLGLCAGLTVVEVPGATGNIHTNFMGKARAALAELANGKDFVYIHVEAPDEAGHRGELQTKIRAIEEIDAKVLGELLAGMEDFPDYKIMVLPDHPTPLAIRTHVPDPVPFLIFEKSTIIEHGHTTFSEATAANCALRFEEGHRLMDYFINK